MCGAGGAGLPCDPPPERDSYDHVSPADPPTCLGGQEPSFGTVDRWILDHVEGFVWPGADVALLREAAATWRSAALSIDHLDHHVDDVAQLLARQRSPEIPLALDVLAGVRVLVGDAALCLNDLGQACEDYATAVEEAHDRTRAILAEIGQMIVEGAVLSVLVAGFTGGLGGGAAAGAVIARITANAPRFRALQTTLQLAASTSATRARAARDGLRVVRERAEKLARVGARDERGAMKNPLGWGGGRAPGWLRGHEVPPGHTLGRHVGKTVEELAERAPRESKRALLIHDASPAERFDRRRLPCATSSYRRLARERHTDKLILDVDWAERPVSACAAGRIDRIERTAVRVDPDTEAQDSAERWQILTAYPN